MVVEELVVKVNVEPVPEVDEDDTLLEIVLEIVDLVEVIVEDVTASLDVVLEVVDDELLEVVLEVVDEELLEVELGLTKRYLRVYWLTKSYLSLCWKLLMMWWN